MHLQQHPMIFQRRSICIDRRRDSCTCRPCDRFRALSAFPCVLEFPFGRSGFLLCRLRCLFLFSLAGISLGYVALLRFRGESHHFAHRFFGSFRSLLCPFFQIINDKLS